MRKKQLAVLNWKMNPPTLKEAEALFKHTAMVARTLRGSDVVVCPPVPFLAKMPARKGARPALGAQDVFFEEKGAYTGYASVSQLTSVGAQYVIIGHSERRARGESNEETNKKVLAALKGGMQAVLCIGEQKRDGEGAYLDFVRRQIIEGLEGTLVSQRNRIVLAYEPVFAIGGRAEDALDPDEVHGMKLFIQKTLMEVFQKKQAPDIPILYGGSVEPANVGMLIERGRVDGFLIGHAGLDRAVLKQLLDEIESAG